MKLTIQTPTFGPLKVALARPFDLAIEWTKIRYGGRAVWIGFQFRRAVQKPDWRLHDFVCEPVRGEISDELADEIRRVGKREIGAWIVAHSEAVYRRQRSEFIKGLPDFRAEVRQLLGDVLGGDLPHLVCCVEQNLREVLDSTRPETFAAAA
jgi:hypothetical protein